MIISYNPTRTFSFSAGETPSVPGEESLETLARHLAGLYEDSVYLEFRFSSTTQDRSATTYSTDVVDTASGTVRESGFVTVREEA